MSDEGQSANARPAGWKKDPTGRHYGRWWDGNRWTEHVISAEKIQGTDPLPPPAAPAIFPEAPAPAVHPVAAAVQDRATAPGWTPAPKPPTADAGRQAAYLILCGAGAVAVGCFLPWATLTAPFVGTISKAGIQGDGVFFLGLAAVVVAVAFAFTRQVPSNIPQRRWTLAVLIAVLGLLTVFEVSDLASRFADVSDDEFPVSTSYGAGLWLVGIGVVVAAAGWLRMPWAQIQRGGEEAPAAGP